MRLFIACCVCILVSCKAISQSEKLLPLNFNSYALHLAVAADGGMALTSRAGETGLYNPLSGNWYKASLNGQKAFSGPTVDQANFFNKDTGFISGFINGKDGKYNLIYHTTDGGHNWKHLNFGQDGWVDDAVNLNNGEAWMSVSGSGIAYSRDYGLHWEKFDFPEKKQRFTKVYFNTAHYGIIGSLWNYLATTDDNCRHWKQLPTPLDQKKYRKTNPDERPAFNNVAIWGDYFLVQQEEMVFFSRRDSISWKWLKQYEEFYTDPGNSALYFRKGNTITKAGAALEPLFTHTLNGTAFAYTCRNNKLYWVGSTDIGQLMPDNTVAVVPFTTTDGRMPQPVTIGYNTKGIIGADGNSIYFKKDFEGDWQPDITLPLPFTPEKVMLTANEKFIACNADTLYYIDKKGHLLSKITLPVLLASFTTPGITQITFSDGSNGCFHSYRNSIVYEEESGDYYGKEDGSTGSENKSGLKGYPEVIDGMKVSTLLKHLPALFHKDGLASVDELGFTEKDYAQCRSDIKEFEKAVGSGVKKKTAFSMSQNNIDFDRLLALVDSIKALDNKRLNQYLSSLAEMWSTTTFTKSIELKNNEGKILSINSRYYEPNAFYTPWSITIDGFTVSTTHMAVYRFIRDSYPAFFEEKNKVSVLHILLRKMY